MAVFHGKRRNGCIGHSDIGDDTGTCGHRGLRYIGADVASESGFWNRPVPGTVNLSVACDNVFALANETSFEIDYKSSDVKWPKRAQMAKQ
jgi:hypothetical protein